MLQAPVIPTEVNGIPWAKSNGISCHSNPGSSEPIEEYAPNRSAMALSLSLYLHLSRRPRYAIDLFDRWAILNRGRL
jgi:hypothetical protein